MINLAKIKKWFRPIYVPIFHILHEAKWYSFERNYYKTKSSVSYIKDPPTEEYCELITVAFNNAEFIQYQIKALDRFFAFPYRHTVFDNSSDEESSIIIKSLCEKYDCGYIRLPKQYSGIGASKSHGIALNWIWKNFATKSHAKYFGTLDHDIMPVSYFDISKWIDGQIIYGLGKNKHIVPLNMTEDKKVWFMWPGFSFFDLKRVKDRKLDFRQDFWRDLDTGGKNYTRLYKHLDLNQLRMASTKYIKGNKNYGAYWSGYEQFDCGWIHMWNGSGYAKKECFDEKKALFMGMLHRIIDDGEVFIPQ